MFELSEKTRNMLRLFIGAEYGTTFTYEQIRERTGVDAQQDRGRVYQVRKMLERDHHRTIINVLRVGYRLAHPSEHVDSMRVRRRRAGTQIELAQRTGHATQLSLLNNAQTRAWADAMAWASRISQVVADHDDRLARIERELGIEGDPIDGTAEEAQG